MNLSLKLATDPRYPLLQRHLLPELCTLILQFLIRVYKPEPAREFPWPTLKSPCCMACDDTSLLLLEHGTGVWRQSLAPAPPETPAPTASPAHKENWQHLISQRCFPYDRLVVSQDTFFWAKYLHDYGIMVHDLPSGRIRKEAVLTGAIDRHDLWMAFAAVGDSLFVMSRPGPVVHHYKISTNSTSESQTQSAPHLMWLGCWSVPTCFLILSPNCFCASEHRVYLGTYRKIVAYTHQGQECASTELQEPLQALAAADLYLVVGNLSQIVVLTHDLQTVQQQWRLPSQVKLFHLCLSPSLRLYVCTHRTQSTIYEFE